MKPAKSSANRCCRSATTKRSRPRSRGRRYERSAALDRRGDGAGDARGARRRAAAAVPGISIDSRTVAPGEAFFAIKGDNRDGHEFVAAALAAGAASRWWRPTSATASPPMRRCWSCRRARGVARPRARGARALAGEDRRRHRLGRQDRHQGGVAAGARRLARPTHRSPRTTITGACRCRWRAARRGAVCACSSSA